MRQRQAPSAAAVVLPLVTRLVQVPITRVVVGDTVNGVAGAPPHVGERALRRPTTTITRAENRPQRRKTASRTVPEILHRAARPGTPEPPDAMSAPWPLILAQFRPGARWEDRSA